MRYIIYAAYGSNMLKERFMVYIKGGHFEGQYYIGSCDKSEPEDLGWMFVPHKLYFAKKSPRWDSKGVAFLSCEKEPDSNYYAIVRLWKISKIQFEDIHQQEGRGYYNIELYLGVRDGFEIITFTGCWENEKQQPSERYLEVIKRGLKETTNFHDREIEEYLTKFI